MPNPEHPEPSCRSNQAETGRWTRRSFLKTTAAGTLTIASGLGSSATTARTRDGLIDCNITLSRWPMRRLPLDETSKLVAKLKAHHVTQAWAASFDSIFHKDVSSANHRLIEECRMHGHWRAKSSRDSHSFLIPFGTVNPKLPDWQEELRRCHEQHKMPGLRLYPNYHGYTLADPVFAELLRFADSRGLILQIALSMEDERMQHPLMRVPGADPGPLLSLLDQHSRLKIVLLNWFRCAKGDLLNQLAASRRIWFDIAMVEGVGGIGNILEKIPADRLLFGSHAPFYYFESAALKLRESPLSNEQLHKISSAAAQSLSG